MGVEMVVLGDVLPGLVARGVLSGSVAPCPVERWHFVLSDTETVAVEVHRGDTAQQVVERFDRALADRQIRRAGRA